MSSNPSAPPPSYSGPPMGFLAAPLSDTQNNYNQAPLNSAQQQQPIIVIHQQPQPQFVIIQDAPITFRPHPARLFCPSCHRNTVPHIDCCCCAPIPYFINSCKNSVHYCEDCGDYLGTHSLPGNPDYLHSRRHHRRNHIDTN